ncbi:lim and sh3 domain protein 1-like [Scleropages formosus]|uniref:LIM and SH3 domain protein 1 n=1 Tax=Scleropages formosus TaxID=113540 RepID=A0A0P7YE11_SCLFO|nr:lim and sh3 domain protein 1-like [Scleropages formosus]
MSALLRMDGDVHTRCAPPPSLRGLDEREARGVPPPFRALRPSRTHLENALSGVALSFTDSQLCAGSPSADPGLTLIDYPLRRHQQIDLNDLIDQLGSEDRRKMNPLCSRCNRVVYPTEKVNCLDKYWHKGCFSCEVCKMTLNMKNYKGFEKRPYCNAHYPKTTFTSVADTPENLRLKQQSKMQSQVLYKEEFEKNKGKGFSVVADTPEMQRIKRTQDQISNVGPVAPLAAALNPPLSSAAIKYHEEFEKSRMGGEAASSQPHNPPPEPMRQPAAAPPPSGGKRYRAMYDYTAADEDEVSFQDGDMIVDVQQIDEGWMYGRVERTGQQGMLPANYVEPI